MLTAYFDGHPSGRVHDRDRPMRVAWLVVNEAGDIVASDTAELWPDSSTPKAEYHALHAVLRGLIALRPGCAVTIFGDNLAVVNQTNGDWWVDPDKTEIAELRDRARWLIDSVEETGAALTLKWTPRKHNLAHQLVEELITN